MVPARENGVVFASEFTIPLLSKGGGKKALMCLMEPMLESQGVSLDPDKVQSWTLH